MTYDVLARTRRTRRRRLVVAGLVAVVFTVATAGVAYLAGHRAGQPAVPAQTPAAVGQPPADTSVAGPSADPEPGTSATLPRDLAWTQVAGVSLPVSAQSGPRDTSAGTARGFAHDQAGAVLAAVHLLVRVSPQVGPAVFDPTLRTQVVGPAAAALRDQVAQQYQQLFDQAHVAYGRPVGSLYATLRGYRIDLYSDTNVALRVMTQAQRSGSAPLTTAAVVQLAWTGSDWALVAPAGGSWQQSMTAVSASDVATYNPFDAGR